MKTEVVVIGSGISGLTAAALLAQLGKEVVVLEKKPLAGGALRRFRVQGISFDVGFHYTGGLGSGQILRLLLEFLEIWPDIKVISLPEEACDHIFFEDSDLEVHYYFSYQAFQEELCNKFPKEQDNIRKYLSDIKAIANTIPFYNLNLPLMPFLREFWPPALKNLQTYLVNLTENPFLQSVLLTPVFLYGVPPAEASLGVHAMVAHSYLEGVYHVEGGGQGILEAFLKRLSRDQVQVLTKQTVETILMEGGEVKGVRTPELEIKASTVIYTGHPSWLPYLLPEGVLRPSFRNRLLELQNTFSAFMVFNRLRCKKARNKLRKENLYYLRSGISSFLTDAEESSPLLLTAPGTKDLSESEASQGAILIKPMHWQSFRENFSEPEERTEKYYHWKERLSHKLCQKANAVFFEGREALEPVVAGSPITIRDYLSSPEGALYGVKHSYDQVVPRARTKIVGLYLSGQSTLMCGIVGASLSALVTVGEIVGLEELWYRVTGCH